MMDQVRHYQLTADFKQVRETEEKDPSAIESALEKEIQFIRDSFIRDYKLWKDNH